MAEPAAPPPSDDDPLSAAAPPSATTPLVGQHVTLAAFDPTHLPQLYRSFGFPADVSVTQYIALPDSPSAADFAAFLHGALADAAVVLWTMLRPAGPSLAHTDVCGLVAYSDIAPQHRSLEIGMLVGQDARRSTAATEAHYLALHHVCERPGRPYRRVTWLCDSRNVASRRAAQRMGYVQEGVLRCHRIQKGYSRDTVVLSLTGADWRTTKIAVEAWLRPENFAADGAQRQSLEEIRAALVDVSS